MNKYEVLFDEILKQTEMRTLKWKQLRRYANTDLIFDAQKVFRQYEADFARGGYSFKIVLVEKKYDMEDVDFTFDERKLQLLVLDEDGELITTLTDAVIDPKKMLRLAGMVETRNDGAGKLFGSLENLDCV
jgi:uncharacterized lipoprotein YehR (DUF1307 family)